MTSLDTIVVTDARNALPAGLGQRKAAIVGSRSVKAQVRVIPLVVSPARPYDRIAQTGKHVLSLPHTLHRTGTVGIRDSVVAFALSRSGVGTEGTLPVGPSRLHSAIVPVRGHAAATLRNAPLPTVHDSALFWSDWESSSAPVASSRSVPATASGLTSAAVVSTLLVWERLLPQTRSMPASIVLSSPVPPG